MARGVVFVVVLSPLYVCVTCYCGVATWRRQGRSQRSSVLLSHCQLSSLLVYPEVQVEWVYKSVVNCDTLSK